MFGLNQMVKKKMSIDCSTWQKRLFSTYWLCGCITLPCFLGGLGWWLVWGFFFVVVVFVGLVFFNQSYLFTHCRGGEHEIMLRYR